MKNISKKKIVDLEQEVAELKKMLSFVSTNAIRGQYVPANGYVANGIEVEWVRDNKYGSATVHFEFAKYCHPIGQPFITMDYDIGVARVAYDYDNNEERFRDEYILNINNGSYMLTKHTKLKKETK